MRIAPLLAACLGICTTAHGQELEPRRWTHLPTGGNFFGGAYGYTEGDIFFLPTLQIKDTSFELNTFALKYIRTFELLGKSARFDLAGAYQNGTWNGLVTGVPTEVERSGWTDPVLRLAVNLYGAPPLKGQDFASFREGLDCETIIGAAVSVQFPFGEYFEDKLINLGSNRFTIRPQLGVVHNRGKWSFEATGTLWFFTDNDDFFGGTKREQNPLLTIQGHVVYTFRPGLWLGGGVAYGRGGESTLDGVAKDDTVSNVAFGVSLGIPVNRNFGLQIGYVGTRTQNDTGFDSDSVVVGASFFW